MQRCIPLCFAFSLLILAGCGGGPSVVKVSGVITLDGHPLEGATIAFQPISTSADNLHPGSGSYGKTNAEGKYELELVDPIVPGAVVGKHRVTIHSNVAIAPMDDSGRAPPDPLPLEYRDGSKEFVVPPEGTNKADFHIHTDRAPPKK